MTIITGTDAGEPLSGTSGNDQISALGGDDQITISRGVDTVDGGDGDDLLRASAPLTSASRSYTVTANRFLDGSGLFDTTFSNLERISIFDSASQNVTLDASGFAGTSFQIGVFQGTHTLTGSATSDIIGVTLGSATVDGGAGTDRLRVSFDTSREAPVVVTRSGDTIRFDLAGSQSITARNIELFNVSGGSQGLFADASQIDVAIEFNGRPSEDVVVGGSAGDSFTNFGLGDVIAGLGGADTFFSTLAYIGGLTILDLDSSDRINLDNPAIETATFIGTGPFTGVYGQYRYYTWRGETFLEADMEGEGDGHGDQLLRIANGAFTLGETAPGSNILQITGVAPTPDPGANTIDGTAGDDVIEGGAGNDVISGLGGNDRIDGGADNDTLNGGDGNDELYGGAGKDTVQGDAGNDTIVLEDSVLTGEVFDGGADFDTLQLRGLSAQFYGATVSGIEEVRFDVSSGPSGAGFYASQIAASGITRIVGSDGYATFTVRVDGNSGTFTMPNFVLENWNSSIDPLTTPGDVLSLSATAGTGDFTLNAREGLASVQALTGGSGNDTLNGSSGRDILVGNGGVNVLNGNGGDDILRVLNYAYPGVVDIGLGSVFNGGDGWDALQLGGVINFQASVSGIEQIHLEPVSGTDPDGGLKAEVTISAQTMAQMSSSLVLSGSGKITVTLAPGDTFDASGYVHAAGSSVALVVDASAAGGSASGSASDDAFYFGAAFSAASTVDGGAGSNDQIGLRGDYTGANALVLGSGTITGVEVIAALPGFDYAITTTDANVPNGGTLKIFAGQLGAGDNLTFNGSAETNGNFMVYAGAGTDIVTTGAGIDGIYFGPGKFDPTVDRVDGGSGTNDQLALDGHYAITLDGTAIKNIDAIVLLKGIPGDLATYNLTIANSLVGATETMTLWGTPVETAITINGAAETDGNLKIFGGTAGDMLTGGAGNDWFWGGLGGDSLNGGAGADTFAYTDVLESGMLAQDEIYDFAVGDRLDLAQIDADAATAGDQAFHLGATAGHTGDVVLSYDAGTNFTAVSLHIDGDGAADAIIFLLGHHLGLGVADFVL